MSVDVTVLRVFTDAGGDSAIRSASLTSRPSILISISTLRAN
jgi:hypothetical protein